MFSQRLKYANIALALLAFPLLGLLARDMLVLKYRPPVEPASAALAQGGEVEVPFEGYSPILEKGAFPSAARELTRVEIIDEAAAGSSHPVLAELRLLGTYAGPVGYAVFEKTGAGEQDVFRAGQSVFGAGTLESVGDGLASLSSGGTVVKFTVFREDIPAGLSGMGSSGQAAGGASSGSPPSGDAGAFYQGSGSRFTEKVSEDSWVIDQKAVAESLTDMGRVLTDARLTPKVSASGVEGFVVTEIKPRGVFDAIGLMNGDVLTKINGYEIDSPEKAVQVLSALRGETSIDLDILRDGRPKSLHYTVR